MDVLEQYNSIKRMGGLVAPPDIRRKAKFRSTQKKRRLSQRRNGGKRKGGARRSEA